MHSLPRRAAFALLVSAGLAGCAEPVGRADLLVFLADGRTTRQEAFLRLGEPSATFQQEQILTYRLAKDAAGYYLNAPDRGRFVGAEYSLVLVFGPDGVLLHHALVPLKATPPG